jgi:6-pyruvoyl-tetrahydropterin synthase
VLTVALSGPRDPITGMLINLKTAKRYIREHVIDALDFKLLNKQIPFFHDNQPTLEALSIFIYRRLEKAFASASLSLSWIEICESDELSVIYDGSPIEGVNLARVFEPTLEDDYCAV